MKPVKSFENKIHLPWHKWLKRLIEGAHFNGADGSLDADIKIISDSIWIHETHQAINWNSNLGQDRHPQCTLSAREPDCIFLQIW